VIPPKLPAALTIDETRQYRCGCGNCRSCRNPPAERTPIERAKVRERVRHARRQVAMFRELNQYEAVREGKRRREEDAVFDGIHAARGGGERE
jgi:hypothetical protein